jgi:hypothetical protein
VDDIEEPGKLGANQAIPDNLKPLELFDRVITKPLIPREINRATTGSGTIITGFSEKF